MKPAVLLLLVLASGCGVGGHSSAVVAGRAAYLASAEAICTDANDELRVLPTPTDGTGLAPYVARVLAIAERASARLDTLTPPAADRSGLETHVLGPLRTQLVRGRLYAKAVAQAAAAHNTARLMTLIDDPPDHTVADLTWMRHYGFHACIDAADTAGS